MNTLLYSLRRKRVIKDFSFDDSTRGWDIGLWATERKEQVAKEKKKDAKIKCV